MSIVQLPPARHGPRWCWQVIQAKHICLGNCQQYTSKKDLWTALQLNRKLIVSRDKAKEHKYVKICLIELSW